MAREDAGAGRVGGDRSAEPAGFVHYPAGLSAGRAPTSFTVVGRKP